MIQRACTTAAPAVYVGLPGEPPPVDSSVAKALLDLIIEVSRNAGIYVTGKGVD